MNVTNEKEKVEMTAAEAAFIANFTERFCRPHAEVMAERLAAFVAERQMANLFPATLAPCALAAGSRHATAPAEVKSPDEPVRFVFASDGEQDDPGAWRAAVTVPPRATVETLLKIEVCTAAGDPAEGVFTISGCALPLMRGATQMPFGLFLAGIRDTAVSLRATGADAVPGRLLFF